MKTRSLVVLAALVGSALSTLSALVACATDEQSPVTGPDRSDIALPPALDAEADAIEEPEPCPDCEYYPETCEPGVLCQAALFDPRGGVDGFDPKTQFDPRTQINVIRGRSPSDVWVGGALGALAHFDGTTWTLADLGRRQVDLGHEDSVRSFWLRAEGEVAFASSLYSFFTRGLDVPDASTVSADGWTPQSAPRDASRYAQTLRSVWATPDQQWLWAVASGSFPSSKPAALWRMRLTPTSTFEVAVAVEPSRCWPGTCTEMTSLHGISADDLWAVGLNGAIVHVTDADGDTPSVRAYDSSTFATLYGVWAASATDAWAVGGVGVIRRYTGQPTAWDVVSDVPTSEDLHAVWGSSPSDVWAVGDGAVVLHFDGNAWSRVKIAGLGRRRPALTTVWVPEPGHVWIGGKGVLLSLGGKP